MTTFDITVNTPHKSVIFCGLDEAGAISAIKSANILDHVKLRSRSSSRDGGRSPSRTGRNIAATQPQAPAQQSQQANQSSSGRSPSRAGQGRNQSRRSRSRSRSHSHHHHHSHSRSRGRRSRSRSHSHSHSRSRSHSRATYTFDLNSNTLYKNGRKTNNMYGEINLGARTECRPEFNSHIAGYTKVQLFVADQRVRKTYLIFTEIIDAIAAAIVDQSGGDRTHQHGKHNDNVYVGSERYIANWFHKAHRTTECRYVRVYVDGGVAIVKIGHIGHYLCGEHN